MGPSDPTLRIEGGTMWAALGTPDGAVSLRATQHPGHLDVRVEGPGRSWLSPHLPALFGLLDDPATFVPPDPRMRRIWKRSLGTHLPRLPTVFARLAQVILLQLVTTGEGYRAWSRIVRTLGEPAPGDGGLRVPPTADVLARVPWYRFVADGVPHKQARTLVRCAARAPALEAAHRQGRDALADALDGLRGVGPWTVGYLRGTAGGDPDAVLIGDYNLPHTAAWALSGEERGSDEGLLRLLDPYAGNRFRVIRALWASGIHAPRRGPRRAPRPLYDVRP
jgi:3-methyladenine DNA glycosylase/8-oxoguanine DNA glycosylase